MAANRRRDTVDTVVTLRSGNGITVHLSALSVAGAPGAPPRLLAHDKGVTKAELRRLAYACVDEVLKTWRRGAEFVLYREPVGTIVGNKLMARMKFQTGLIEKGPDGDD